MVLLWCTHIFWSISRTSRTSFLLFLPSLLLLTRITAVHAALPCPRSCSCPGVKEVHCTFRHLTAIPKTFPKDTERLNLGYNSLTEVEGSEFRSLRQLEMLMLHGNDINTLHAGAFYSLTSLQILKLSYNKLTSVSIGLFEGLVGLVRLHLDHNLIASIEPYSFSGLPSLKLLQLEGNLLKEIHPHTFITVSLLGSFWTSGLKHLHLSDNLLEFLPAPALKTAPRLELLSLHGNPWSCDCQLQWLLEWSSAHEGVIKCKKERESGSTETCPQCLSPQSLNGTSLLELHSDKVPCERPILKSTLKQFDNPIWAESSGELDHPYVKDLEKPLGHLTFVLSDSHANSAHVACDVRRPGDSSPMTWSVKPHSHGEIQVNVSLATALECEIDRETLQNLWQLVAYYYESPAILQRGQQKGNNSRVTYQYAQVVNENSPYFTDLKGYLVAEPFWLLQRRVSLRLNRKETTTKKLVMDFTTTITKDINIHRNEEDSDLSSSWALIRRGTAGRVQTVVEGSKAQLECSVFASDPQIQVEWMLPDFSIVETGSSKVDISESGKLVIINASRSDSGLYYCMTKTKAGVDLMPLRLTVKERVLSPTAFNGQKVTVAKGDSFSLPCQVTSVNPSQILWYLPKNNVLLPTQLSRRAEVTENGTLLVKKFTAEDAGEYSCLASNLYGVDMLSHVVELTGDKLILSRKSKVKTEKELGFSSVDAEGSGAAYQEITRPFATQFPKTQKSSPNRATKRIQIKDTKSTSTSSAKELLPRRHEDISTNTQDMPRVTPTQKDPPTDTAKVREYPSQTSGTMAPFTPHRSFLTTTPVLTVKPWGNANVETGLTERRWNEYDEAESAQTQTNHLQTSARTTKEPFYRFQETDTVSSSFITKPKPNGRARNQQRGEGRRRVVPGSSNRRRPPYRQRIPPLRRFQHNSTPLSFWHAKSPLWKPVASGRIVSRRPTAVPPYPWVLGSGGNGVKPHITTLTPASVSVLAEGNVVLDCKATGNPEPTVAWTKVSTGATIPANSRHGGRFEVLKNGTFVIKTVQLQDRGQYLCTAQNRFGSDRMVMTLAVQTEPPKIQHPKSFDVAVYVGKGVTLDCLASGRPLAQISWILPDRMFVRDFGTVHSRLSPMSLLENGTLQIHSANFSGKGDYKCIASNAAGADTVTYHLHVAALPPSISEEPLDSVLVSPGKSVYVHCSVKGEPVPSLKWTLPTGAQVKPSQFLGRKVFVYTNGTLYLKNISPSDAGSYECSATNTVGTAKRTVQLRLQSETPALARRPPAPFPIPSTHRRNGASRLHSVTAMHGSAVYLHCPESSESSGRTIWQLPSKAIMDHRHSAESQIKVFRNGTLRILQLTERDGGAYLCISQRPNGENIEHFQVQVLMTPPRIEHVRTKQAKVTYGENFQVDCVATGLPDPEVSWSLPDGTLINNALQSDDSGQRSRRYVIFGNGTLFLQHIGKSDEGDYTCYAQNKVGKDERKVSVKIEPNRPKIRFKSPSLVKVKFGEAATLTCQATGEPPPKIIWISPKNNIIQMTSEKFWIMEDGTLVIKKVKLADEGKYTCVARNSAGDDVTNTRLEIDSHEPLIKGTSGRSTTKVLVISYQSALLDCKVDGKPEPRVWWVTPHGHSLPAPYIGGRFQVHQNKSLELRGVRKADEGKYICLAKNSLGDASLLVELEVASHAEKPSFTVPNIEIIPIKQDGREMILDCTARGKPDPDFAWVLPNGTMLLPGSKLQRFIHILGNGSLKISQPEFNDKGVYRCLAKNVAGQAEKRYSLEAGRKPLIRGSSGQIKISYGQNFNLHCSADGWPQPSIKWTLPNGLVLDKAQTVGRASVLANGTLQLRQVAMFDKGTYTCNAFNSFGSSTMLYSVTVTVFPPRITSILAPITRVHRGSPVVLHCLASGTPRPDISWTLPGRTTLVPHNRFAVQGGIHMTEEGSLVLQNPVLTNSGIYKCNAKNALGTDFKSTYLQVV
ncbi:immunoglobulin superfamily member 10 [Neosynchiropus ocellatus]